jgi:hypothetical protein
MPHGGAGGNATVNIGFEPMVQVLRERCLGGINEVQLPGTTGAAPDPKLAPISTSGANIVPIGLDANGTAPAPPAQCHRRK